MKNWMKEENIHLDPHRKMQFLLLLVVSAAEALFMVTEAMFHSLGYHLIDHYIAIPCFMFLGTILGQKLSKTAKWNLSLSITAALWFVLVQFQHRIQDLEVSSGGLFFLSYLMAFPFASVMEDQKKNIGMKLVTTLFLVGSLVLVGYSVLLVLDWVPAYMERFIYWDGTRLYPIWHPNIAACIFMIGIGTSLSYMFHTKKNWKRMLLILAVMLQFFAMSLTNCRTSIIMTCVLMGFALFLAFLKGQKRRYLAAVAAALVLTAASFALAGGIYEGNQDWHKVKTLPQLQSDVQETIPRETVAQETISQETVVTEAPEMIPQEPAAEEVPETTFQETAGEEVAETIPQQTSGTQAQEVAEPRSGDTEGWQTQPESFEKQEIQQNEETGDTTIQGNSRQGTWKSDLKTLNGRTRIWRAAWDALCGDKTLRWWGTDHAGVVISDNGYSQVEHAHNSWIEMLLSLGIPGLMISLIYTAIGLWSAAVVLMKGRVEYWKKMIAVLILCMLVAGFLEPFLFYTKRYYQFVDFIFFFFLGYLDLWRRQALHPERYAAEESA